jgi:hypothetical protein
MPRFTFLGEIIPISRGVTISNHPQIFWEADESGLSMLFSLSIVDGQIIVECDANRENAPHQISQMHLRAVDIARTAVNLVSFTDGFGRSISLHTMIRPDGSQATIVKHAKEVLGLCTSYEIAGPRFDAVLRAIYADPQWFSALNDLIESISIQHTAPRNCGRAIEAIRSLIGRDAPVEKAWALMQATLNVSKDYLKVITDASREPRHGSTKYVPYDEVEDLLVRAWTIMNRFIEYKLRGDQRLPLSDFPLLD